ncbi:HisA/HisF-related TIM barrel protein [Limisalsivibrio acetivorans]|uniref:oxidoreductase n=1 Tax=Limisalsivibrio acetivorans TaxID=1304888 RepID=UPI0003B63C3A|nr:NADH:flavin oxidoreductase [Limisalsivibrio acetivorans]
MKLFEEIKLNNLHVSNRAVRSATCEGAGDEKGSPNDKAVKLYEDLADGGTGLIISSYIFVSPEGKELPGHFGMTGDEDPARYRKLTEAVHLKGSKIIAQLVHTGGQTSGKATGGKTVAPSAVSSPQYPAVPEALSKDDIKRIIGDFGSAAKSAKEYGFDGVQIHGAHGYLVCQFLSPLLNRREDEYGGGLENRARFLMEIYAEIRKQTGEDFHVGIKLNGSDNIDGGFEPEESVTVAEALQEAGIDHIEVSAGTPGSGKKTPVQSDVKAGQNEGFNLEYAEKVRERVKLPLISVGGYRTLEKIEEAFDKGMDMVSLSRPLIREPGIINRWKSGDKEPSGCISCNGCFRPLIKEGLIRCTQLDK